MTAREGEMGTSGRNGMGTDFKESIDPMPLENKEYGKLAYWNQRFKTEQHYDWLKSYAFFRDELRRVIRSTDRILIVGCGNSTLGVDMYNDGFVNITNIDYSHVVIENMQRLHGDKYPHMKWLEMDMLDLRHFPAGSFDVCLEKGTMDVLFVEGRDHWNPPLSIRTKVFRFLDEVHRVLDAESGRFVSVTFAQPHFRRIFYDAAREESTDKFRYDWDTSIKVLGDTFHYFVFTLARSHRGQGTPSTAAVAHALSWAADPPEEAEASRFALVAQAASINAAREQVEEETAEEFLATVGEAW